MIYPVNLCFTYSCKFLIKTDECKAFRSFFAFRLDSCFCRSVHCLRTLCRFKFCFLSGSNDDFPLQQSVICSRQEPPCLLHFLLLSPALLPSDYQSSGARAEKQEISYVPAAVNQTSILYCPPDFGLFTRQTSRTKSVFMSVYICARFNKM